jgi:hypothetical protein
MRKRIKESFDFPYLLKNGKENWVVTRFSISFKEWEGECPILHFVEKVGRKIKWPFDFPFHLKSKKEDWATT